MRLAFLLFGLYVVVMAAKGIHYTAGLTTGTY